MNNNFQYSVIGDNTPENREHLEKLGYKMQFVVSFVDFELIYTWKGRFYFIDKSDLIGLEISLFINCLGNPALFRAVTAMKLDDEKWLPIAGFEESYLISNYGRVKSLNFNHTGSAKDLIIFHNKENGYSYTYLYKDGIKFTKRVHRLVAQAFIPNPHNYPEVNHMNENGFDNRVCNLEWCDRKYNINFGNRLKAFSHPVSQLSMDGIFLKTFKSIREASRRTGIDNRNIGKCVHGIVKSAGGFKWIHKATLAELQEHFK